MFLSLLCLFQVLFLFRLVQFFLTWKPNMTTVKPDTVNQAHPLLAHFACANHGIKKTNGSGGCPNEAKVACGGYGLVVVRFSNPVMEAEPTPCLCNGGCMKPPTLIYGANKYLWGTIPAIDVIKPQVNEGVDFQQDIDFLFAASGDLSNAIVSIGQLPDEYKHTVTAVLNDKEFDVVTRNAIMLLIAQSRSAWYSRVPMYDLEDVDYVDRVFLCQLPSIRMGSHKFRTDSILLPFGASRVDFVLPNPYGSAS
ncbi:hypothetical protein MCOR34_010127 [Pyricularia oryzae]|nr:hypothetical protein MCOR34_010127 [Pyricularia oryzae]KAI6450733.1 hypothetical protein MCOR17_009842 [Pyricularia oryzae]KAI6580429.1 hypothetical protein MCOR04_005729 [Pyricularia oryzae]